MSHPASIAFIRLTSVTPVVAWHVNVDARLLAAGFLDALHDVVGRLRLQQRRHVLDADRIAAHIQQLLRHLDEGGDGVQRADGVADRSLRVLARSSSPPRCDVADCECRSARRRRGTRPCRSPPPCRRSARPPHLRSAGSPAGSARAAASAAACSAAACGTCAAAPTDPRSGSGCRSRRSRRPSIPRDQ